MIVIFVDIGGIVCWPYLFTFSFQNQIGPSWSCSYVSWISNSLCNQCISPLTCDMSMIFSGFLHQYNWPPRYNWNIVEGGVKHHYFNSS